MNAQSSFAGEASRFQLASSFLASPVTNYLFAVCVIGLTFKQLQTFGAVGPIEILTAALCLAIGIAAAACGRLPKKGAVLLIAAPVVLCLASAGIAALSDPARMSVRDAFAYVFTAVVVWTYLALAADTHKSLIAKIALVLGLYLTVGAILWVLPTSSWTDFTRYPVNGKFQGLSNNPNQIALLTVVGVSMLFLVDDHPKALWRAVLLSVGIGAAGAFTGSSAILLALGASLVVGAIVFVARSLGGRKTRFPLEYIIPFVFSLLAAAPIGHAGAPAPEAIVPPAVATTSEQPSSIKSMLDADGGEGSIRLEMWSTAVQMIATSPIIGLGPGPHVPWTHPISGETTLNEAHNTILDILLVAGALGLLASLAPVAIALRNAWMNGAIGPTLVVLCPIGVFAMFHYVGRQPLVWILFAASIFMLKQKSFPARKHEE